MCSECGRSFTHSSNLALHKNSHSGHSGGSTGSKRAGEEPRKENGVVEMVVGGAEEVTTSMLTDMVRFVSQEGGEAVGVGMEEVFLSAAPGQSAASLLPQLTLASTQGGGEVCPSSRPIGTEVHLSTDNGTSVLLYSCGSCNHTFGTRTELEEHQSIHMAAPHGGHGGDPGAALEEVGDGLVGAGHLLADFEEVVETTTTTVGENAQTTEVLLELTEAGDDSRAVSVQRQSATCETQAISIQSPHACYLAD